MNSNFDNLLKYQSALAQNLSPKDYPPIEGIQDVFDIPTHLPPNFDFSHLTRNDYNFILNLAKREIESENSQANKPSSKK